MNAKNIFFYVLLLIILYICYHKKETFTDSVLPNCNNPTSNLNTIAGSIGYFYAKQLAANYNNISIKENTYTNIFNSDNMKGIIVAWYDDINTIPDGWAYCNGSTYKNKKGESIVTPDLRSRTILGASNPTNITGLEEQELTPKSVSDISGFETVTISATQAPEHSHWTRIGGTVRGWLHIGNDINPLPGGVVGNWEGKGCKSGPTNVVGGGKPHNNMPPYMALIYIMKID